MKFQGINHEFHVHIISLLFYAPKNSFKMLNKQTKVQASQSPQKTTFLLGKICRLKECKFIIS